MVSDAITGLMLQNPDFTVYAKHNVFHLKRFFLRKMGLGNIRATKIFEEVDFNEYPSLVGDEKKNITSEKIKAA